VFWVRLLFACNFVSHSVGANSSHVGRVEPRDLQMRENLSPAILHEDAYNFKIGDLLVRKYCIHVIVGRSSDTSRSYWDATGFYFWNAKDVCWESTRVHTSTYVRERVVR
jgi:hypothetical protein